MIYKIWCYYAILSFVRMKEIAWELIKSVEGEIVLGNTVWSRDWERFNQSYVGKNEAEELTNDELIEYLRWMACNKPGRYAQVMTAFAKTQGRAAGMAV